MGGHIQSTLNMTEAVTQVQQIQEYCKEEMPPSHHWESKTIPYREQCHSITKEVDELLDRVTEGTKEQPITLRLTQAAVQRGPLHGGV
jgi:hypothetical protein